MKTIIISAILLFAVSISFSQVITIEEFLQTTMTSKEVTHIFSYDFKDDFYSSNHSDKYLSITYSHPKTINTDDGLKDINFESRIDIFSSQGRLLSLLIENEKPRIVGFIEGETDYYIFEQRVNRNHEIGIYNMDGNLLKPLSCGSYVYSSPHGKFYYHSQAEALSIYNENGYQQFVISTSDTYAAKAASDSTLLVFEANTLSYWNIKTQKMMWDRDIPSKRKAITDGSSRIQCSMPGNVIVLNSMFGYYCFNFQGDFLWADEDYGVHNKLVNYTGVSENSGDVAIIYSKYERTNLLFAKIFNHEGILLEEHEIELGENVKFAGNCGFTAMLFNDYILVPITARTADQGIEFATCILYKENQSWSSAVVSGFWYFLSNGSQMERLIGYDSRSQQVKGYEIK